MGLSKWLRGRGRRHFRLRFKRKNWHHRWKRLSRAASNWLDGQPVDDPEEYDALIRRPSMATGLQSAVRSRGKSIISKVGLGTSIAIAGADEQDEEDFKEEKESRPPLRFITVPQAASKRRAVQVREDAHHARHLDDDYASADVPNYVRTAKYSMWTFLPKNLAEQFRRVANVYFAMLVVLQAIPVFSNFNAGLASIPLLSILLATAIKDGIEDWRRHRADNEVNYAVARRLHRGSDASAVIPSGAKDNPKGKKRRKWHRPRILKRIVRKHKPAIRLPSAISAAETSIASWRDVYWQDLRVGDIILLRRDEPVPADTLILSTSEPDGQCYVETQMLDGETNLKVRSGPLRTQWIRSAEDACIFRAIIEAELPNSSLYTFSGRMHITKEFDDSESTGEEDAVSITAAENDYNSKAEEDHCIPLSINELLLRGCILRNTGWIIGCIVYTGAEARATMNAGVTPSKRSRIERQMNPQIILSFAVLFVVCLTCAIVQGHLVSGPISAAPFWTAEFGQRAYASGAFTGFLTFWSCLILFQTIVPISLYITVEICKTVQAYAIYRDPHLCDPLTSRPCQPRSWTLADDLGQIEYIFADKTGTLTQNVMQWRRASINGVVYGGATGAEEARRMDDAVRTRGCAPPETLSFVDANLVEQAHDPAIELFMTMLCTCHTVLADESTADDCGDVDCDDGGEEAVDEGMHGRDTGQSSDSATNSIGSGLRPPKEQQGGLEYKAQSPDEGALVTAARDMGFVFLGRHQDSITIDLLGTKRTFRLLAVLEFTSARRRMSVIVRDERQVTWLFCKGADSVIFERLAQTSSESLLEQTREHLQSFAKEGLRTLCFAARIIDEGEYVGWAERYREARAQLGERREQAVEAVSDEIEQKLSLLGATAIEDRLQEGVPECIAILQEAGIRVWVLTGDKLETAINVGFACRLLCSEHTLLTISHGAAGQPGTDAADDHPATTTIMGQLETAGEQVAGGRSVALIIDGDALQQALEDDDARQLFVRVADGCRALVVCRASPLQKAQVVGVMRRARNAMCLAIGDGANDVGMLHAADIGVGIAGQEGMQAVMASDYAVSRFRHLARLLLVHGRWAYRRTAGVTLASFYKNIAFVGVQFWYQFYCAFSAQYSYDYLYMLLYNAVFSVLPVLALGIGDWDVSADDALGTPALYRQASRNRYSMSRFGLACLDAIWQTVVCFFVPLLAYLDTGGGETQWSESLLAVGNVMAFSIIIAVNATILCMTHRWTWWTAGAMSASLALLFGFMLLYTAATGPSGTLWGSWSMLASPTAYLAVTLAILLSLIPRILWKYIQRTLCPTDLDIILEAKGLRCCTSGEGEELKNEEEMMLSPNSMKSNHSTRSLPAAPHSAALSNVHPTHRPSRSLEDVRPRRTSRHMELVDLDTMASRRVSGYAFSHAPGLHDRLLGWSIGRRRSTK